MLVIPAKAGIYHFKSLWILTFVRMTFFFKLLTELLNCTT